MKSTKDVVLGFGTFDYVAFIGMLFIASSIGIYYAIKDRRQNDTSNYNFGGRQIPPVPLGLSIAVTFISALTVVGLPNEVYLYGLVAIWYCFGSIIPNIIACLYYIPLLHKLKLNTIYQYLEYRFDHRIRKLSSVLSIIKMILYMGITVYLPSIALNAVTPISLEWSIVLSSGICTFYTALGGMKAVVWTDTLQSLIMLAGSLAALIKTTSLVGGFGEVWVAMVRGGRANPWMFNFDPTMQRTFWTILIGYSITKCHDICCTQASGQRFLSCKSVKDARKCDGLRFLNLTSIAVITGCAAYAYYENCDPLKAGKIEKSDQLIPFLVSQIFNDTPGMTGLFVSAAYCGTLSTVSSGINAVGALVLEDFILARKPDMKEIARVAISKFLVVLLGLAVAAVAFLANEMSGTVVAMVISISGVTGGPLVGLFTLGIFFPWTNVAGAFVGHVIGTIAMFWIAASATIYGKPEEKLNLLPTSVQSCELARNTTNMMSSNQTGVFTTQSTINFQEEKPYLYYSLWAISYFYYSALGFAITVFVGLLTSFATGANSPADANPEYFLPFVDSRFWPEKCRRFFRFGIPDKKKNRIQYKSGDVVKVACLSKNQAKNCLELVEAN